MIWEKNNNFCFCFCGRNKKTSTKTNLKQANSVESRQLAAQVDGQDYDDWLFVARLLEEIMDVDPDQSVGRLFFHLFQLSKHLFCVTPQSLQCCGVGTSP